MSLSTDFDFAKAVEAGYKANSSANRFRESRAFATNQGA